MKNLSQCDCREANFYFYLFIIFYSCVCDEYPCVLTFHGVTVLHKLSIHGVITYIYLRSTGDKYDSITCLTAVQIPLLPSDKIISWISVIPFFDPFLEVLGSEFLQHMTQFSL